MKYYYKITGRAFDRPLLEYYYSDKQRTRADIQAKMKTRLHCDTVQISELIEYEIEIIKEMEL